MTDYFLLFYLFSMILTASLVGTLEKLKGSNGISLLLLIVLLILAPFSNVVLFFMILAEKGIFDKKVKWW